jgi:hypothetical protein
LAVLVSGTSADESENAVTSQSNRSMRSSFFQYRLFFQCHFFFPATFFTKTTMTSAMTPLETTLQTIRDSLDQIQAIPFQSFFVSTVSLIQKEELTDDALQNMPLYGILLHHVPVSGDSGVKKLEQLVSISRSDNETSMEFQTAGLEDWARSVMHLETETQDIKRVKTLHETLARCRQNIADLDNKSMEGTNPLFEIIRAQKFATSVDVPEDVLQRTKINGQALVPGQSLQGLVLGQLLSKTSSED